MMDDHDHWFLWPPWTWIAHGAISLGVASVAALILLVFWQSVLGVVIAYDLGAVGLAVFFNLRESRDRRKHMTAGHYDHPQQGASVSSREDRVGDLVGPYAVAASALVLSLLMAGAWVVAR
jgi:hypothetical protein